MNKQEELVSKQLSYILRHNPSVIGITLDVHGWAEVEPLLKGMGISLELLNHIVETDPKMRYSFNTDRTLLRANQGHSIKVDLELVSVKPPELLYHGTAQTTVDCIIREGLKPLSRTHVHLSGTIDTAISVGKRHGKPVVLSVRALDMHASGYTFYLSANKVWLTDSVPTEYITVMCEEGLV